MAYISQYRPGSFDPDYRALTYGVSQMAEMIGRGAEMEAEAMSNLGSSIGNAIPTVVGGYLDKQKKKEQEQAATAFMDETLKPVFSGFDSFQNDSGFFAPAGPNGESGTNQKPSADLIEMYAQREGMGPTGKSLLALAYDPGAQKNFLKTFGADKAPALVLEMVNEYANEGGVEWSRIPGTNYMGSEQGSAVPMVGQDQPTSKAITYVDELNRINDLFIAGEIGAEEKNILRLQALYGPNASRGRSNNSRGSGFGAFLGGDFPAYFNDPAMALPNAGQPKTVVDVYDSDGNLRETISPSLAAEYAGVPGFRTVERVVGGTETEAEGGAATGPDSQNAQDQPSSPTNGNGFGAALQNGLGNFLQNPSQLYKNADRAATNFLDSVRDPGTGTYNFGPMAMAGAAGLAKAANDALITDTPARNIGEVPAGRNQTVQEAKDEVAPGLMDIYNSAFGWLSPSGTSASTKPKETSESPLPNAAQGWSAGDKATRDRIAEQFDLRMSGAYGQPKPTEGFSAGDKATRQEISDQFDRRMSGAYGAPNPTEPWTASEESQKKIDRQFESRMSGDELAPIEKVNREFFDFEETIGAKNTLHLVDTTGRLGPEGEVVKVKPGSKEYKELQKLGPEQAFADLVDLGYRPIPDAIAKDLEAIKKADGEDETVMEDPNTFPGSFLTQYLAPVGAVYIWNKIRTAPNGGYIPGERLRPEFDYRGKNMRPFGSKISPQTRQAVGAPPMPPAPRPQSPYVPRSGSTLNGPVGSGPFGGAGGGVPRRRRFIP